jgi:multidrug efflux pump subunit AcrA (membrane-fusion protein)
VGSVESVSVAAGDEVSSGDTLLTLTVASETDSKESLEAKRDAYIDMIERLQALSATGAIYASTDGTIGTVSVSEGEALSKDAATEDSSEDSTSTASQPASSTASQPTQVTTSKQTTSERSESTKDTSADTSEEEPKGDSVDYGDYDISSSSAVSEASKSAITTDTNASVSAITSLLPATDEDEYDNMGSAFTILSDKVSDVNITVDELDITSLAVGQEASVEMDAFEGQSFTGVVTSVSDTADSSSNYANYSADIAIAKTDGMLAGMSATVTIVKEKAAGVLTLPLEAVQEYGDSLYVYTSVDETEGTLSGETQITTGLSNGSTVEITSGLSEGDTVYYEQTDSAQDMAGFGNMAGGFGGMQMPGGTGVQNSENAMAAPPSGQPPTGGMPQ